MRKLNIMDSFYDAPRRPPQPIPREMFLATPVVPEISVLCPSNTSRNPFTPYNQWKKDVIPNNFLVLNKENINSQFQGTQNTSILKKQVRFESPVLQQKPLENNASFVDKTKQNSGNIQAGNESNHIPHNQGRVIGSFEEMYMANVPNRQLDLSVIDVHKRIPQNKDVNQCLEHNLLEKEPKEKEQPKTYREFLESRKQVTLNDSVTDIFNYKRNCSPKEIYNTNKIDVEGDPKNLNNRYSPVLKDLKYEQNKIIGKNDQTHPGQHFRLVTQAISQRNIPMPYENSYTQDVEQIRKENGTVQKSRFVSKNNECDVDLQNNLLSENTRNQIKTSPQEMGSVPRNKDLLKKNSEDAQNKPYFEPTRFEVENKNNNLVIPTQVDNRSRTVPSVSGYNLESPNSCKTSNHAVDFQKNHERYTQTSNSVSNFENALKIRSDDDDFSVKDLLKIIAQQSLQISQQNEQLLLLQKQVSTLICQKKSNDHPRPKSIQCGQDRNCCQQDKNCYSRHCCSQEQYCEQTQGFVPGLMNKNMENIQDRCITSTQHENCDSTRKKLEATTKKNKNMPNFSIGLTTSFEVSFRRPHYKDQNDFLQKNKQLPDFDQYETPKIQEITETDLTQKQENYQQGFQNEHDNGNKETLVDESMIFKEPIRVREPCPSPEPSIKINMNDFEDSESEEDLTSPEIGTSFYRNLMVQVNKILKKAEIETSEEVAYNFRGQHLKHNTLHKVKEATLKHLKRIGVEVHNSEDSSSSSFSSSDRIDSKSYTQDDISFAVKQLLMKYLPADHLAKVQPGNQAVMTPKEKIGAIKNRPDFSFATVQYMKKYNLIASNQKDFCQAAKQKQPESPKVLDITKLKQQPKLL